MRKLKDLMVFSRLALFVVAMYIQNVILNERLSEFTSFRSESLIILLALLSETRTSKGRLSVSKLFHVIILLV